MAPRSAKVVRLRVIDTSENAKRDCNKVLRGAIGEMDEVVVCGTALDGSTYLASSRGPMSTLWTLEWAKQYLMRGCKDPERA